MVTENEKSDAEAHTAWTCGELEKAFSLFHKCAENGDASCMLNLGFFYDEGIGVAQSKSKAMRWYIRAYRKGCSGAASNIAILYREKGMNEHEFKWFQRSVALGDGDSEVELAKLYMAGTGTRKSITKAKELLFSAQASTDITQAGREEAVSLLNQLNKANDEE